MMPSGDRPPDHPRRSRRPRRPHPRVLLVAFREDRLDSHTYRVPLWSLWAAGWGLALLVVLLLLGIAFYAPVAREAARVPGLSREVARLRSEQAKAQELAVVLDSLAAGYERLRGMVGADLAPAAPAMGRGALVAPAILARAPSTPRFGTDPATPTYWPLEDAGFVTRGASDSAAAATVAPTGPATGDEAHPGLDIAVREGTIVRATAGGTVTEAGQAGDYGLYVLVRHGAGYESLYGHLSRILVAPNALVVGGAVLGLSGNTGRSSAPHLHFEIRQQGRPVDPSTLVKEVP